jgi:hypothetical protein
VRRQDNQEITKEVQKKRAPGSLEGDKRKVTRQ